MSEPNDCLVVTCVCGGWVMVAALGWGENAAKRDAEHVREAARMVKEGFAMRMPVPIDEFRAMPACDHRGDCTTGKKRTKKSTQLEAAL